MARQPRLILRKHAYELSFRTEEGLPLSCSPIMLAIIAGVLARALTLYNITLCHDVVMGNHIHMVTVVEDPEHLHRLVMYIKRELSHAINKLLGRKRKTVWEASYNAVAILDTAKVIERIAYIYLNPARADLETSIEKYPNFNTWEMCKAGIGTLTAKRIPRHAIPKLPRRELSDAEEKQILEKMLEEATEEYTVTIEPDAWLDCVMDGQEQDASIVHNLVLNAVYNGEERYNQTRKRPVIGAENLRRQSMRKAHRPAKFGKKMHCMATLRKHRMEFVNWVKDQFRIRQELKDRLSTFEFFQKLPPGFFAPGGRLRANLNPQLLPV